MTYYICDKLKAWDGVGARVGLTYEKKASHGTVIGGLFSVLATIIVLFFVFSEFY